MKRLLVIALAVAAAVLLTVWKTGALSASTGPATPSVSGWRVSPDQFVALDTETPGIQAVTVNNVRTGAVVRKLLPATASNGMQVTGLALDRAGNLWITYSEGPASLGNSVEPAPKPGTCSNQIDVVHAGTGRVTVFQRTGDNVLISDAQPSPDGTELVYVESSCTGSTGPYLRVTSLPTGRSWTIGQGLSECHLLYGPAWSTDGRSLLVSYAPASVHVSGPVVNCPNPRPVRAIQLDPDASQPGLAGTTMLQADHDCTIERVTGEFATERCGPGPSDVGGPGRLLVLGTDGHVVKRLTLGKCEDGSSIADAGSSALVSVYLYCAPGPPGPENKLWEYRNGSLRLVTSAPGYGGWDQDLAWPG